MTLLPGGVRWKALRNLWKPSSCSVWTIWPTASPCALTLTVEPERKGRSTQQNRLMWSLLTIMADAYNAGAPGGVTPEECYLDMLQKYGAKVDYLEVPAGALEILRRGYRLVHVVEILDNNRCTVKCTRAAPSFTTAENENLIDRGL